MLTYEYAHTHTSIDVCMRLWRGMPLRERVLTAVHCTFYIWLCASKCVLTRINTDYYCHCVNNNHSCGWLVVGCAPFDQCTLQTNKRRIICISSQIRAALEHCSYYHSLYTTITYKRTYIYFYFYLLNTCIYTYICTHI